MPRARVDMMSLFQADASSAECLVFTSKEGILSPVAHDLKLRVTRLELAWDGGALTARFDPRSLRVVDALKRGRENPGALAEEDKAEIERKIVSEVLHARRYPSIDFRSTGWARRGKGYRVDGDLTLHGVTRRVSSEAKRRGDSWVGEVRLDQRDFGIEPYSALLGTLKVKPEVRVRVSVVTALLAPPAADR